MKDNAIANLEILIVDDDRFTLKMLSRQLAGIGCTSVELVDSGKNAIERLSSDNKEYDIIICDLNMPEIDGVELIRHVVDSGFKGGIIFLSGEDQRILKAARTLAESQQLNVLAAISKPLKFVLLDEILYQYKPITDSQSHRPHFSISEQALCDGLQNGALLLAYQPQVDVKEGRITGVEVLARWRHEKFGILGPGVFLPLVDKYNLIDELTRVIYTKATKQIAKWLLRGIQMDISVNVEVNTFSVPGFFEFLIGQADSSGVNYKHIKLEVTESQVMSDEINCIETLTRLGLRGFGLSIDDFGTGHSSLEQLKRIPFTELKLDRSFVHTSAEDSSNRAIVESSIELAKKLNLRTVAEGVETVGDWNLVAELGCDRVQGYYLAKPMFVDEFESWLNNYHWTHNSMVENASL
ncbi:MAG: EAL domain-containing response regulator [Proteobacteria bacterium]|nr:EAL domain-containing response regulator [Pseudomonadota bacterium]